MGMLDPKLRQAHRLVAVKRAQLEREETLTARRTAKCDRAFAALWHAKLDATREGLVPFHDAFSRLQNVSLEVDTGREGAPQIDEVTVAEIGRLDPTVVDVVGAGAVAGAAGAAAYGGTTAAVMTFATASTGTAISSLSGAAASNAALAWLGGGSLAAGGGGMAAGAVVLATIAAVPTVAVAGLALHLAGRRAMAKAETYEREVEAATAKHREARAVLGAATRMATDMRGLLGVLTTRLARETRCLCGLVETETDWVTLTTDSQDRIRSIAALAVALSELVDTTILDERGAITDAIRGAYKHGRMLAGDAAD